MRARSAMIRTCSVPLLVLLGLAAAADRAWGDNDPPHNFAAKSIDCMNCHTPHDAPGGALTKVEGNSNLCMSCHNPAGIAAPRPFNDADQALPGQVGTSHRFDSGPSGHVEASPGNTSTGKVMSGGEFAGRIEKTYTITITMAGDIGAAVFGWVDSDGNGGSELTAADVPLNDGLTLTFTDATLSPSFALGDSWTLYVRTDLRLPDPDSADIQEFRMARRVADGKVVCSVCHDQHRQDNPPFDANAPDWNAPGDGWLSTGVGRHYQRKANDSDQMCKVCHSVRDVQSSHQGSHPVGVAIPAPGPYVTEFQTPPDLPLDVPNSFVQCSSCHSPHFTDSGGANGGLGDGYLLRKSIGELCFQCHTLADQNSGSHFQSPAFLWPGGQYGSSFPAHTSDKANLCVNCHWPHGWPDDGNMMQDYPKLWVERYDAAADGSDPDDAEDLCYTCHDGSPAQTNIRADFLKGAYGTSIFHHPVMDSEQSAGRSIECVDCHNPHRARSDNMHAGVSGVDLNGSPVGYGTSDNRDILQYELCFKCHGDTYNTSRPRTSNKRLDMGTSDSNSGYHPITQAGRNQSANLNAQLKGGLTTSSTIACTDCHNSDATGSTDGPVTDSAGLTQGPHGSTNALILRANFSTNYTSEDNWSDNDAALCFLCHDRDMLLSREWEDGARTNFYQYDDRDNLHWYHLTNKEVTRSCLSCHFDIHSNRTASNTEYRWKVNGQWFTSTTPPPNVKTHLVNFAPDVQPNNFSMPRWEIDTETGTRRCDVSCHGKDMDGEPYEPPSGDDPSHTY